MTHVITTHAAVIVAETPSKVLVKVHATGNVYPLNYYNIPAKYGVGSEVTVTFDPAGPVATGTANVYVAA